MLLHASALSIIFIYYKRWYPTPEPEPEPTPAPTPTPTWRSTHFPARSRKISGKNCVADDKEEAENSVKSAWQKQSVLPLPPSSSWLPGHPWAVYQQQPTSAKVVVLVVGGAWHAFINIYDSIKVCIRHSGGRAAAAAGATLAAESLSPALVALCVCLFVCCALHATCKLQHKVKPRSKCNYEKPFELGRGKNCTSKYKKKTP